MSRGLPTLTLIAICCLGCESTSNYEPPRPGVLEESVWRDRVNMSTEVQSKVAIDEVLEMRQNGLLQVQVEMRNFTQSEQGFRILIEWFDVSGFRIESPNDGWMSHLVHPEQKYSVNASAVNPAAVSWRVNLDTWTR